MVAPFAVAALAFPDGTIRPVEGLLHERETEYQYARVVQRGDERRLELNEGHAVHSVDKSDSGADWRYWDAILIDAYRQPYSPFHLVTKEFFALVRDRLTPRGRVVVNVGGEAYTDDRAPVEWLSDRSLVEYAATP